MSYLLLTLDELKIDPLNLRRQYENIGELAESIRLHGLLQNLVVERDPHDGKYIVRAGNRRFKALLMLRGRGEYSLPVPCLENGDELAQVVENIQREDVTPWALGHRYSEILDRGISAKELATALGKQYGHVSFHINLARCIHPDAQRLMESFGYRFFTKKHLGDLCRMVEPVTLEPLRDNQIAFIEALVKTQGVKREGKEAGARRVSKKTQVVARLERLKRGEAAMDPGMKPYVAAVVDYLEGVSTGVRTVTK